jgi:hypothetical protein
MTASCANKSMIVGELLYAAGIWSQTRQRSSAGRPRRQRLGVEDDLFSAQSSWQVVVPLAVGDATLDFEPDDVRAVISRLIAV